MTAAFAHIDEWPRGTRLRKITDPATVGTATGQRDPIANYDLVEVELADGTLKKWRSYHVEPAPLTISRANAFAVGRFGGVKDLRRTLMVERLRGDLTDVFYSMGTSDTDFMPHQFKPVLRFIESTTSRLLIADEVGLGKTIEAMLIWKELEARERARRLLILCPSVLRDKWRGELARRFRIDARIVGAAELAEACRAAVGDPTTSFALIAGFDALRPRSRAKREAAPRDAAPRPKARDDLEDLLEEHGGGLDAPLIDFLVVDEAHYARNRETATNRLVRALDDNAAAMALLTATPIQLSEDNLFQLMRLIDPDRFPDADVFDRLLRANEPVVDALYRLRQTPFDLAAARTSLLVARSRQPARDPVLDRVAARLDDPTPPTAADRVELAHAVERASILSSAMVRSRKRDVLVHRVERNAVPVPVRLGELERRFYTRVSRTIAERARATAHDARGAVSCLALVTRQRQMASCMPAAARAWRADPDIAEQMFEDFGLDESATLPDLNIEVPSFAALRACDGKFEALRRHLAERRGMDPHEKFVLFSFFRGTLAYLDERLREEGLTTYLLQGGLDDKTAVVRAFETHVGGAVLLSSEVGSEGIDLQFCRTLINYDLPWNPMRVEQRIGRLDRIGQAADRIHVVNLRLEETVEDRILNRLYERVGVFRRAIGDLESILGDRIQELVVGLYRDELDDAGRERRAEQTIAALAETARSREELEEQASNLVAFKDHLLDELREGRDLGRWIDPGDLRAFCIDSLADRFPGSKIEARHDAPGVYRAALSPAAKADLDDFLARLKPSRGTRLHQPGPPVDVAFDPQVHKAALIKPEFIEAVHPLTLWLREGYERDRTGLYPAAASSLTAGEAGTTPGTYVVAVDRWQIDGLRRERRLRFRAWNVAEAVELDEFAAERLVRAACQHGESLPVDLIPYDLPPLVDALEYVAGLLSDAFLDRVDLFEAENASLCDRQIAAVRASARRRIGALEERLRRASDPHADSKLRRTEPLIRAQLAKAEEGLALQEVKMARSRRVGEDSHQPIGLVAVVRP